MSDDPQPTVKLPAVGSNGAAQPTAAPVANGDSHGPPTPEGQPPQGAPAAPPRSIAPQPAGAPPQSSPPPAAPPVGPARFPIPGRRKSDLAPPSPKSAEEAAREAELREEESAELIAQRDRLLEKFTVMQADLGGAFYEMAIRDHVRLDVLTRRAAELQRVDAELLAVERALELERSEAAGLCPGCGAPYGPAVRFCAQCGTPLFQGETNA